jgi:hypothetical protein
MRLRTQKVGWKFRSDFFTLQPCFDREPSAVFRSGVSTPVKCRPLQPAIDFCIIIIMPIELERLEKPIRKLRSNLKHWPSDPSVEMVHKFRTQTRRLEATLNSLNSFMLEQEPEMRRLLKAMRPVRKAAGARYGRVGCRRTHFAQRRHPSFA